MNENLIFDAHCHYDDEKFDEDRDEVLSSLPQKGVFAVVTVIAFGISAILNSIPVVGKYIV